jgi:hypothetical protein
MRVFGLPMAVTLLALLVSPAGAQDVGRPQDGFYSGQSNGQYSGQWDGQVDSRVDGRASRQAFLQAQRIRAIEDSTIPLIQETVQRPRC